MCVRGGWIIESFCRVLLWLYGFSWDMDSENRKFLIYLNSIICKLCKGFEFDKFEKRTFSENQLRLSYVQAVKTLSLEHILPL